MSKIWSLRDGTEADGPVVEAMLVETIFWQPETERFPLENLGVYERLWRYVDAWGRPGDCAVIAVAGDDDVPIGAAWYRLFSSDAPGFGFVNEETPELGIGIVDGWRGFGIGSALMTALCDRAREAGIKALSLSVEIENERAVALYRRLGFEVAEGDDGNYLMVVDLTRGDR